MAVRSRSSSTQPCDLHEITNCSICTGLDKIANAKQRNIAFAGEAASTTFLPPGHALAQWSKPCANPDCGVVIEIDEVIRYSKTAEGWVGLTCCS